MKFPPWKKSSTKKKHNGKPAERVIYINEPEKNAEYKYAVSEGLGNHQADLFLYKYRSPADGRAFTGGACLFWIVVGDFIAATSANSTGGK